MNKEEKRHEKEPPKYPKREIEPAYSTSLLEAKFRVAGRDKSERKLKKLPPQLVIMKTWKAEFWLSEHCRDATTGYRLCYIRTLKPVCCRLNRFIEEPPLLVLAGRLRR